MNMPNDLPAAPRPQEPGDPRSMTGQLGREITSPLSSALQRVTALTTTGKIRRGSLQALRDELEHALRAGTAAQELCQLVSAQQRLRTEPIDLHTALRRSLTLLSGGQTPPELPIRVPASPALVSADPALTQRLLTTLAQWARYRGSTPAQWVVEASRGQLLARVVCRVQLREPCSTEADRWTIDWRLIDALSTALSVRLLRRDDDGQATVALEFARALAEQQLEGMLVEELDADEAAALYASTVAGTSVLIVAGRRETREAVQKAVKPLGLIAELVGSVDEARQYCDAGLPHAVVHESRVRGVPFEPLRIQLLAQMPTLAMVEIFDEEREENVLHEIRPRPRVRGQSLERDLPPLLLNELTRALQA